MTKSKPIGIGAGIVIDWNYYDLLKNIDELEGKVIHFTGTINVASKKGVFGINVGESSIKEDVIFVEYDKEEFVKRNIVEGFGYVKGIRNIERTNSVGGADILEQVPNIQEIKVSCTSC